MEEEPAPVSRGHGTRCPEGWGLGAKPAGGGTEVGPPFSPRCRKYAENMYYFSELALTLNAPESGTAPTDSRRRPDQRLMENGRWDEANAEKQRLEEKQRISRKRREAEAARATEDGKEGTKRLPTPLPTWPQGPHPLPCGPPPSQAPPTIPTSRCGSSARRTLSPRSWRTSTRAATGRAKRSRTGPCARTFSEPAVVVVVWGGGGTKANRLPGEPPSVCPSVLTARPSTALACRGCLSRSKLTLMPGWGVGEREPAWGPPPKTAQRWCVGRRGGGGIPLHPIYFCTVPSPSPGVGGQRDPRGGQGPVLPGRWAQRGEPEAGLGLFPSPFFISFRRPRPPPQASGC